MWIILKHSVGTVNTTQLAYVTNTGSVMLFRQIITLFSQTHTKIIHTFCGQVQINWMLKQAVFDVTIHFEEEIPDTVLYAWRRRDVDMHRFMHYLVCGLLLSSRHDGRKAEGLEHSFRVIQTERQAWFAVHPVRTSSHCCDAKNIINYIVFYCRDTRKWIAKNTPIIWRFPRLEYDITFI